MNYEKPEVVVLGSAAEVIQGNDKSGGPLDHIPSSAAYEADE